MSERRYTARLAGLPAALMAAALSTGASAVDMVDAGRAAELERLVRQDCGSCHGMRLSGGLGPDIRGAALADFPAEVIATIILDGLPATAMPPWRPLISEEDAQWIATYLKNTGPR